MIIKRGTLDEIRDFLTKKYNAGEITYQTCINGHHTQATHYNRVVDNKLVGQIDGTGHNWSKHK